ncbi:hypothetical protein B0H14DRAFT_2582935 [Mycena olivaceomarginata]|nr:hypothetical protein B0H14DRAFT_2582935 [Mycena olivaceomarginata]
MPLPSQAEFRNEGEFFAGQIICCDHGDSRIDNTARSENSNHVQQTGKIRPCLVVGVNTTQKTLWLAPMSGMTEVQHPGWEALEIKPPIQFIGRSKPRIWVGTPAVTPMIFMDVRNMYWCPQHAETHGPDFDNSVPPPPRIHAGNASRFPHTAQQQRHQSQLTQTPLNPQVYTRHQLAFRQLQPQRMAQQYVPAAHMARQQHAQPQLTQAPRHPQAHAQQQLAYQQQQMAQQHAAAQFQQQQQMAQQHAAFQQQQVAQRYAAATAAAGYSNQMQTPVGTRRYQGG